VEAYLVAGLLNLSHFRRSNGAVYSAVLEA
jgi:hypothetical protein